MSLDSNGNTTTQRIVMFSGGIASWAAGKRVAERYGTDGLVLLFADTMTEDADLYRFLAEASANVGGELVTLRDGRDIWQVFRDERMLGNSRADPCSRILKREPTRKWVLDNCDPESTVLYHGYDWSEWHRLARTQAAWTGWTVEAPLCWKPYITRDAAFRWLEDEGIRRPLLYELGLPHNNCGGGCVKAGQAHWAHVLRNAPSRYATWERNEAAFRAEIGKDVAMLTDRRNGERKPLTLRQYREGLQAGGQADMYDWGGCDCFTPPGDEHDAS